MRLMLCGFLWTLVVLCVKCTLFLLLFAIFHGRCVDFAYTVHWIISRFYGMVLAGSLNLQGCIVHLRTEWYFPMKIPIVLRNFHRADLHVILNLYFLAIKHCQNHCFRRLPRPIHLSLAF